MLAVARGGPRAHGPQRPAAARRAPTRSASARAAAPQRRRCVQCSSCPSGCRLDAKRAMHVSYLPRAVAAGRADPRGRRGAPGRVRPRARHRPRLHGVAAPTAAGAAVPVHARKAWSLAGGAFGTPELLLRSGLRSPGGELGSNLRIHPACWVGARFDDEVRGWDGRDAELRASRVGGARASCSRRPSRRSPSAPSGSPAPAPSTRSGCSPTTTSPRPASTSPTDRRAASGWPATARCGSHTGSPRGRRSGSCSESPARRSSSTRPGPPRSTRRSPAIPTIPRGGIAELRGLSSAAGALRLEAFHPMGTARMDADPRARGRRDRRRRPRRRRRSTSPTAACCRARSGSTR